MKYSINGHVRMILLWADYLGFDNYQQAESAILKDPEWYKTWDTTDWQVKDVEAVALWRETQIANSAIGEINAKVWANFFAGTLLN